MIPPPAVECPATLRLYHSVAHQPMFALGRGKGAAGLRNWTRFCHGRAVGAYRQSLRCEFTSAGSRQTRAFLYNATSSPKARSASVFL